MSALTEFLCSARCPWCWSVFFHREWGQRFGCETVQIYWTSCDATNGFCKNNPTVVLCWPAGKHFTHLLWSTWLVAHRPAACIFHSWPIFTMKLLRIWPFSDFLGVLPDHVVLPKDEEGPVHGEAVLPHRDGVVQRHGAGTLRFGLLEGWGDATCGHGRPISVPVSVGPSIRWTQQARHIVSKPGHSVKSKTHGREDGVRQRKGGSTLAESRARCCAQCDRSEAGRFSPSSLFMENCCSQTSKSVQN